MMKILVFFLAGVLLLTVAPTVGFSQDLAVDANTVLLFRFEEINGDTVKDYSGNGNDGQINGNIQIVEGIRNNGYQFDGQSHILVEKSDTLDITKDITIELWVKCDVMLDSGQYQFVLERRGGDPRSGYELYLIPGNFMNVLTQTAPYEGRPSDGKVSVNTEPEIMPVGEWQYCAVTYDGENVRIYAGGNLAAEAPQVNDLGIETDLYIGGEKGTSSFFTGALASLRISNVARTATEIRAAAAIELSDKITTTWARIKSGE